MEWSFSLIKPDAIKRNLIGKIISKFEAKGLILVGLKMAWPTRELIEKHYEDQKDEPHFQQLVDFMAGGPVIAMVWEGPNAVTVTRNLIGVKDPVKSTPGSIRGDFALEMPKTIVHGARSPEEAEKELQLWFHGKSSDFIWEDLLGTENFDVNMPSDTKIDVKKELDGPAAEGT